MTDRHQHNNSSIAFIDTEIEPRSRKILDLGGIKNNGSTYHETSVRDFIEFIRGSDFICGHNIFRHDLNYIAQSIKAADINPLHLIDTLYFSPLLFPTKPYHSLLKDDKLQSDEINNPLNDSMKARDLFYDEVAAFAQMDGRLKQIFYLLLHDKREFQAFFKFLNYTATGINPEMTIKSHFENEICGNAYLSQIIAENPIELAYSLSLIDSFIQHRGVDSITPPWVLKSYPEVDRILFLLRNNPCIQGCGYCNKALDAHRGLKRFFGYDSFRSFDEEPLQEKAVKAALNNKSLLAVFPTGGGKSLTFQVPALMAGENSRALTIVISPLQSLMKDQVDNLEKTGITDAVTINGLLDPIERAKSFERVEDGSASILYISPESLRSRTIERIILGRKIARFVIDEAHCFSSWGQDFRVDYLYIADFIRSIEEKKNLSESIPVSCFTATAKQKVIEDIRTYFKDKLSLELELFTASITRTNLHYKILKKEDQEEKYQTLRDLILSKDSPCIVYVSRTRRAYELAKRLTEDGFNARPYHGKMDKQEKSENQDAFINGDVQIMVATSAFGMGVDKNDVGMVIHYDISDSLENYVQEAGRAGRDENIVADCYVLFNEEDLNKHFILLNQTKISIKEIQQVWRAIKYLTKFRSTVSNSALEIARKAGWDDSVIQIETRVTTAIAALEEAGYLKRGQNIPRVFANSILSKNAQEAIDKIQASANFDENQKSQATRIIKKLISNKSRKHSTDEVAESRVDYISDHLGIVKGDVIRIINLLREEKILADKKDLTAFIKRGKGKNRSLKILESYANIENFLLPQIEEEQKIFHLKELNENAEGAGIFDVSPHKIKTILNFWAIKRWIKRKQLVSKNHLATIALIPPAELKEKLGKRHVLARFIIDFLYKRLERESTDEESQKEEILVEFSVHELKEEFERRQSLFTQDINIDDIEDSLFYLSRIEAMKIEGGFLVVYNSLTIKRKELNNRKQYTKQDYVKLDEFYKNKIQQIHIVGEYARQLLIDYENALQFVEDYFQLNYSSFLNKYFKGNRRKEISRNLTPIKFKQLFGELSPTQLKIINDNETQHIVVAAGPGSGKTRVLVHKLASLLLMEDVKHEQLLMVTFSRAAAGEFKKRLIQLIGNAALFVEIKTFHSYCFDLLGKIGTIEKSAEIIRKAAEQIKNHEVEASRITKTVLVIDEAQDMDADEFELIKALMEFNEEMRVIAVGDDDQNIYEFRGSDSKYLEKLMNMESAVTHELLKNYRSKSNLVHLANQYVKRISRRLKHNPIIANQPDNGKIKIVKHKSKNLTLPLVKDVFDTDLSGTCCILTWKNKEALQIIGLLLKKDMQARLIQSNDGFNLYNLLEVRFFLSQVNRYEASYLISKEVWTDAIRELKYRFSRSDKLDITLNIIKEFDASNPKSKYKSDLEVFIRESKLEDFFNANGATIFVSTMHKAKGREFDNVFLMLEDFKPSNDAEKRLLYVAMTRAKKTLTIHTNSGFLDNVVAENLIKSRNDKIHKPPKELALHLTLRDIWLSYFAHRQNLIRNYVSGDELFLNGHECRDKNGNTILKFSKQFVTRLEEIKSRGYIPVRAKINFIVFWYDEGRDKEIKVILPELYFRRQVK